MIRRSKAMFMCTMLAVCSAVVPAAGGENCTDADEVALQVAEQATRHGNAKPEFRITKQDDGQALLYWRYGMDAKSFYAVTIRADGCAVLTDDGQPRRFVFPRSAYNTGVFEEMARFDAAL